jgi:hypothetical protein
MVKAVSTEVVQVTVIFFSNPETHATMQSVVASEVDVTNHGGHRKSERCAIDLADFCSRLFAGTDSAGSAQPDRLFMSLTPIERSF